MIIPHPTPPPPGQGNLVVIVSLLSKQALAMVVQEAVPIEAVPILALNHVGRGRRGVCV